MDIVVIMTDEERAAPSYESPELTMWRKQTLTAETWFDAHAVSFDRHYTGSLACVPSRPTLFTGHYPDLHGVTQTDGLAKTAHDSRMRWLRPGEVPTLGNWFQAAGWDTHYDSKWHITHADLVDAEGEPVPTNDSHGVVDTAAVQAYLDADPLAPFGFSGWVGPEPHGGLLGNAGVRRDPLIADRVCAWLGDRYARRAAGEPSAARPFLLVASFVNPHDIVLFPVWMRRDELPIDGSLPPPPPVDAAPTGADSLADRPGVQRGYRDNYASMYGPHDTIAPAYVDHGDDYRDLYYRLHAEVDGPIDRVRRALVDAADAGNETLIVRTSDHGELLGSHGGLHQKWFQLYDEATRVPFHIARVGGSEPTTGRRVDAPTSHLDLVPTLLGAAGIDRAQVGAALSESFTEVHPLPGLDLMRVVDGGDADRRRFVYAMTRDHIIEGDDGLSAAGRVFGDSSMTVDLLPAVASNVEGVVGRVGETLYKLVRTFDDPATWTLPNDAQRTGDGWRHDPVPDEWELYDLDADPAESTNLAHEPEAAGVAEALAALRTALETERSRAVPARNHPWPYSLQPDAPVA